MAHDTRRNYGEFARAIGEENNPEKLEKILDDLLKLLAEERRMVPGPEDHRSVHSMIRSWRFV